MERKRLERVERQEQGRNVSVRTVLGVPGGVPSLEAVTTHSHPCVPHVNLGLRRLTEIA